MTKIEATAGHAAIGALTAAIGFFAATAIGPVGIVVGVVCWIAAEVTLYNG